MHSRSCVVTVLGFILSGFLTGCGTLSNGRGWGQEATLSPGWVRAGQAAWNAAVSPETYAPVAAALAFRINHADQNASGWAVEHTPVFGSRQNADRMSDYLVETAGAAWVATALAAPGGEKKEEWLTAKIKGFGVEGGAGALALETVEVFKGAVGRMRPDGSDNESFPSGHSAGASLFTTLASRNIEALSWSGEATTSARIGLGALTAATAWARVEAGKHYPSDVLAGIAIGHFFGAFVTDAFLGLNNPRQAIFIVEPSREGAVAILRIGF